MSHTEIEASVDRIMGRVDYYLHCELDEEYNHERPDNARARLEAAIRHELDRASAVGLLSEIGQTEIGQASAQSRGRPSLFGISLS